MNLLHKPLFFVVLVGALVSLVTPGVVRPEIAGLIVALVILDAWVGR